MLADTLTGNIGTFTKRREDTESGSVYTADSGYNLPVTLTVKHSLPVIGKSGVARHLVSLSFPTLLTVDGVQTQTGSYVTINCTIVEPDLPVHDISARALAMQEFLKLMTGATTTSAFNTAVLAGTF